MPRLFTALAIMFISITVEAATGVHTTYLWHMHQPIYWPAESGWTPGRYETAYETITLGHSQNSVFDIFNSDDRVGDYQWYPRDAVSSIRDLPEAGAQVSFAGALIENITSLGDAGWNGGRYASDWYRHYREARGWSNSLGKPRLEPVLVGFHHGIGPLMDDNAFRMELACAKEIYGDAWGGGEISRGFFPAEMCFSERLIPALVDAGVEWSIVPDLHIARACGNYPFEGYQDNCDPPNRADQVNPDQAAYTSHSISRGVTLKVPYPYGFTPHRAEYVDPATGVVEELIVVPAANAMSWDEGYGMFGTGSVDAIAAANDPLHPMLVLFAHDGDNAWSGGYSYYYENVTGFSHQAAGSGYTPTTVATYLAQHPVDDNDVVHVEDGGWVNADGDFGSPQYINWNWPPVNQSGAFDIPAGWAEDERNWAVLTAAQNIVETAEAISGPPNPARVVRPLSGASAVEQAWHFLLAGYESGYMYYGTALDMEIKATLACNAAVAAAEPVLVGGGDTVAPTVWLPQRLPWNPGGRGAGSLWGYPGGAGAEMGSDFHIWTYIHDFSGLSRIELMVREDVDGVNDPAGHDNETYLGGADVGDWTVTPMNLFEMPSGEPWEMSGVDFSVLPDHIADRYWAHLTGYSEVLLDYYIEAEDVLGNVKRSPIQHVWVGEGGSTQSGFVMDGERDATAMLLEQGAQLSLWAVREGDILYVATEGVSVTENLDHFLMICDDTLGLAAAPWAKAGTVAPWDLYLAGEDGNGWCGWFDADENVQTGAGSASAQGSWLEGALDLNDIYEGEIPAELWLAAAGYGTNDGDPLIVQVPAGDGDGDLDPQEYHRLPFVTAIEETPAFSVPPSLFPNPFNPETRVRLSLSRTCRLQLDVFDARGRHVANLHDGLTNSGEQTFTWSGVDDLGHPCASGVYLIRVRQDRSLTTLRGVLLK
ncbi:MAG: hypothetical protein GY835_26070 [bacterium]|nr:hypothetical protein [bacterium]